MGYILAKLRKTFPADPQVGIGGIKGMDLLSTFMTLFVLVAIGLYHLMTPGPFPLSAGLAAVCATVFAPVVAYLLHKRIHRK